LNHLYESTVILRYLCNAKQIDDHFYPKDPKKRGFVDLYLNWHDANAVNLIQYTYTKPGYFKKYSVEEAKKVSEDCLKSLEELFLSQRKFVASDDKITIGDLAITWHLAGLIDAGADISPRVKEYYERVVEYPGVKDFVDDYMKNRREWYDFIASTKKSHESL